MSEREDEGHKPRGTRGWQVLKMFTRVWLEGVREVLPHVCSPEAPGTPPVALFPRRVLPLDDVYFCCIPAC